MSDGGEDIDLANLADDDLVKQMHDDLYDGLADEIVEGTTILLDRGWGADRVLDEALVEGMRIVGIDFRDGILFVPEVLLAANAMKAGMAILRPAARRDRRRADRQGRHRHRQGRHPRHRQEPRGDDARGRRLRGVRPRHQQRRRRVPRRARRAPARHPRHVGAAHDDDAVHEGRRSTRSTAKGLRDDYIVLVGGAPLNEEFGQAIGADAYCRDAVGRGRDRQGAGRRPAGLASGPSRRGRALPDAVRCGAAGTRVRRRWLASCAPCSASSMPTRSRCGTCRPTCTTGPTASSRRSRGLLAAGDGGPPAVFVGLRRLRHRRRARRAGSTSIPGIATGCPARTATSCSPAPSGSPRCTTPSPAPSTSPTSSPGTSTRSCGRGSGSTATPSCCRCTSATTPAVVLLSQSDDPALVATGQAAAERLGLRFEHHHVGTSGLAEAVAVGLRFHDWRPRSGSGR